MLEEGVARYLAGRVRQAADGRGDALAALLDECRRRGFVVLRHAPLRRAAGLCCSHPGGPAVILLASDDPRILAHELFHAILADNAAHGIDYSPEEMPEGPEAAAEAFARHVLREQKQNQC